jgi:membrane-associated phospholipid phosphatase
MLVVIGGAVVLTTMFFARHGVYMWEVAVFQAINELPDALRPVVWVLNQYGSAVAIPVATLVALLFRRWVMAAALALSGVAVYVLSKVMKEYVSRGRPGAVLAGIAKREVFESGSLGYPSGHAAVAWAITVILLAYLARPWGIVAVILASTVTLARLYMGAHLPLDLIGGAALGVAVASAVNLLLGVPAPAPAQDIRAGPARPDPSPA